MRLRQAGWAGGRAGAVGAAIVTAGGGPQGGALGLLQHAGLEGGMAAGVLHKVVTAHEPLLTQWALEALLACVRAVVPRQLVRAGELLTALGPGAGEGPLSCETWGTGGTRGKVGGQPSYVSE